MTLTVNMLDNYFELIERTRKNFLDLVSGVTVEELNKIPQGFNNNIIWNLAHIVVSQQVLCYKLSDIKTDIDQSMFPKYGRGSRPETFIPESEIDVFKSLMLSKVEQTQIDYKNGMFKHFNEYTTSYGIKLSCIEDAIRFVGVHEGLHYGYSLALKRAIRS